VATKSCPSCMAEVPVEAFRCKHCFHDFHAAPKQGGGPVVLLGFIAAMLALGGGVMAYIHETRAQETSLVDDETKSIIFTRKSASGVETERIAFDRVKQVEYVMGGSNAMFEIVAVTNDGGRYSIKYSDKQIKTEAMQIARLMKKDLVEVQKLKTFAD
jgi:fructose-1,6-bisphosphatase/sedoheptulose 1,7-bisphosphatase-like protein